MKSESLKTSTQAQSLSAESAKSQLPDSPFSCDYAFPAQVTAAAAAVVKFTAAVTSVVTPGTAAVEVVKFTQDKTRAWRRNSSR